jgi:hypothetical protein
MAPRRPQADPPTPPSSLKVPLSEAKAVLAERIAAGGALRETAVSTDEDVDELRGRAGQWRDYNRTWLDRNLGGELAKEYRESSTHYGFGGRVSPHKELELFRLEVQSEIGKLQSISDRLDILEPTRVREETKVPHFVRDTSISEVTLLSAADRTGDVFIVHGSDLNKADAVARVVERETDRGAIILHEQPNGGRTLIEKLEANAQTAAYAVVVLTADDEGRKKGASHLVLRGRQNVVFELGFFCGAIGRSKVCVLFEEGVEQPSDIKGLVYIEMDVAGAWKAGLVKEFRHAGIAPRS